MDNTLLRIRTFTPYAWMRFASKHTLCCYRLLVALLIFHAEHSLHFFYRHFDAGDADDHASFTGVPRRQVGGVHRHRSRCPPIRLRSDALVGVFPITQDREPEYHRPWRGSSRRLQAADTPACSTGSLRRRPPVQALYTPPSWHDRLGRPCACTADLYVPTNRRATPRISGRLNTVLTGIAAQNEPWPRCLLP